MTNTRKLVMLGLLTALTVVLARFLAFQVQILRISLEFIPIMIAAMLFGPLAGGIVGALADVLGYIIKPIGTFFPGFTISAFATGFIYGLFFHKKQITWFRSISGTLVKLLVVDFVMVGTWLIILYKMPIEALLPTRLLKIAVMLVVETVFVYFGVRPLLSRLNHINLVKQSSTAK